MSVSFELTEKHLCSTENVHNQRSQVMKTLHTHQQYATVGHYTLLHYSFNDVKTKYTASLPHIHPSIQFYFMYPGLL